MKEEALEARKATFREQRLARFGTTDSNTDVNHIARNVTTAIRCTVRPVVRIDSVMRYFTCGKKCCHVFGWWLCV